MSDQIIEVDEKGNVTGPPESIAELAGTAMPDDYPKLGRGRIDPGDAFILDDEAWFVCASGSLAILATNRDGKTGSFTAERLTGARRVGPKWTVLMQSVGAIKGALMGYKLAPQGMPAVLREWFLEEMEEMRVLVEATIDELEERTE